MMHPGHAHRPLGPRDIHRSASPARGPSYGLPEVAPLNVRKHRDNVSLNSSNGSAASLRPPSVNGVRSPTPTNEVPNPHPAKLALGNPAKPGLGKMKLKLDVVSIASQDAFAGGYGGGPQEETPANRPANGNVKTDGSDQLTLRPEDTISPRPRAPPVVSIDNLRQTVDEFDQCSDDDFEELQRLGEGAGGAVYKVRDKRTGMVMARKAITTLEAPMHQLMREIKITSSTSHPNIVHFYGAYMSPSSREVKVLMEFGEGGSLESVSKRMREYDARVGEKVAGRLAEGILQGLAYLHSRKTIHRDIKPPNILITREGIVKLCDFGVSGELVNSIAGTFTGTSLYMAPERLSGLPYTIRSDVWSTGISLLELVQNRFPFPPDLAAIELMLYVTQNEPPELEDDMDAGITWSADMKSFIKAALTRDPNIRPTPKDLLSHPWIVNIMKQDVNMASWIRQVWGWRKPRKSGDSSRPSTSGSRAEHDSVETAMAGLKINGERSQTPPSVP